VRNSPRQTAQEVSASGKPTARRLGTNAGCSARDRNIVVSFAMLTVRTSSAQGEMPPKIAVEGQQVSSRSGRKEVVRPGGAMRAVVMLRPRLRRGSPEDLWMPKLVRRDPVVGSCTGS